MAKGKKEEFLCLQCHQKVTENQHSVCCCICDRWIHKDCGLDDDEYKLIKKKVPIVGPVMAVHLVYPNYKK